MHIYSEKPDNFEWIVEATANMAIRRAQAHREGLNNLTRGEFITAFFNYCPSINGIFRPWPVFSLFAILDVALLRLRLQNRCGLGQGRNLPFLDGR